MSRFMIGEEVLELEAEDILNVEAMAVQKKTGLGFREWMGQLHELDPMALTAWVWIARKRHDPTLKFEDVSFPMLGIRIPDDDQADDQADDQDPGAAGGPSGKDEPPAQPEST